MRINVRINGEDWEIMKKAGAKLLAEPKTGASTTWDNPKTKHGGTITITRQYTMKELPCVEVELAEKTGDQVRSVMNLCRVKGGNCKFAY